MWQRFTERAQHVVFFAQDEARRLGETYVSTEHLLLGLVREHEGKGARILDKMGVSLALVRSEVERQATRGDGRPGREMQLTPRSKRVIDLAYDEARQLSINYIGTEHLLLGLLRENEGLAARVLTKLGVGLEQARAEAHKLQDHDGGMPVRQAAPTHQSAFAAAFAQLPEPDRAALKDEGLALNRLSAELQNAIQQMFEASIRNGAFILDPNAVVRVNVTEVAGASHYTVTAKASFLINFLTRDTPF